MRVTRPNHRHEISITFAKGTAVVNGWGKSPKQAQTDAENQFNELKRKRKQSVSLKMHHTYKGVNRIASAVQYF